MEWSSKAPDQKRSIPLVSELGMLERCLAKLEVDEDYGEALLACKGRVGWSQAAECFFC